MDSLVDRLGAKFRGSGGSVGANGAPSTGILGSNSPPAAPAPPKTTRPAASAPVDKVNASGQRVNAAGRTDAQLAKMEGESQAKARYGSQGHSPNPNP